VLFPRASYALTEVGPWDTMGMRGTCSPPAKFSGHGTPAQIVPGSFADSSALTMVPYSHILWSALWTGIASDAVARAAGYVRGEARKKPGTTPPQAIRLAQLQVQLQSMRHNWEATARAFDEVTSPDELQTMGWALRFNNLKIGNSDLAPKVVHEALQIIGIMGYKNDSKVSVARHYRDVLSASLMVTNERIAGRSASMLLVFKDD
jgi:acyl-CoA dehydrogenase